MDKNFDKKIKQEMSAHRATVDADAIWKAIEPEVDAINEKRKKRRGLIWFLLAGLLMAGGGYYFLNNMNDSAAIAAEGLKKNEIKNDLPQTDKNNNGTINNLSEKINTENGEIHYSENDKINIEKNISKKEKDGDEHIAKKSKDEINSTKNNKKNIAKNKNKTIYNSPVIGNTKNTGTIFIDKNNKGKIVGLNIGTETSSRDMASKNPSTYKADAPKRLPLLPISLFGSREQELVLAKRAIQNPIDNVAKKTEDKISPAFAFSIGVHGSVGYAARQLKAVSPEHETLLKLRDDTEIPLETVVAGVRFRTTHKSGVGFVTGLQYTRMAERLHFEDTIVDVDSIDGIQALAVNLYGDTTPIYGKVPLTTTKNILKKHFNSYRFLDVPVLVNYNFKNKNAKWAMGVEAGIFANISLKTKGEIYDKNMDIIDLEKEQPNLYKSKIGLSYYIGLTGTYDMSQKWRLAISPHIRYFPKNIAADNYRLEQKYTLYGLDMGLYYRF